MTVGATVAGLGGCRLLSDSAEAETNVLRAIRVNHDKCTGCRICEQVCDEFNHKLTVDGIEQAGPGDPHRSLITIHSYPEPYYVAWACLGCPDLPCVRACDYYADRLEHRKALHVDQHTGEIRLAKDWCAGCEKCIEACESRGGNVLRWDKLSYIAGGCNLCHGDPQCVKECPVEAIEFIEVDRKMEIKTRNPDAAYGEGIRHLYRIDSK